MKVYLDNAATTPLDARVMEEMMPYFTEKFGNPSSIHAYGRETKAAIERARKSIAAQLNASTGEIFFTSGGTESANMAIDCAVRTLGIQHIITSPIEHHCVLHTIEHLEKLGTVQAHFIGLDEKGNIRLDMLQQALHKIGERALVCLMHANNEIGNILDLKKAGEICAEYDAIFFSDTVQTVAHYPINLQEVKVHFISGAAHKFHGPKGIGFIYINSDLKIHPLLQGGGQERNMRAGTENLYGIMGMAKAMELAYTHLEEERAYVEGLKNYFYQKVKEEIPGVEVNGNWGENSLYTVLNLSFPAGDKTDFLMYNLDIEGIAVSAGSACSSGSDVGSHVIKELPTSEGHTPIRFSFSRMNTREELDYVLEKLKSYLLVDA